MKPYKRIAACCHAVERYFAERYFRRMIRKNHNLAVEVEKTEHATRVHKDGWISESAEDMAEEIEQTTLGAAVDEYGTGCLCSHCFCSFRYEPTPC